MRSEIKVEKEMNDKVERDKVIKKKMVRFKFQNVVWWEKRLGEE
jgi:hypothetical protein